MIRSEFAIEVLYHFHFLINDYKFKRLEANRTFVRYESKYIFVNIYHGRRSYELGVEIGQREKIDTLQKVGIQ